jgi:uncharacterized metal-binding protein
MTPDSDQDIFTYQDWITKNIDYYFSILWYAIWWAYSKAIPHRSWLSHSPIIGTFLRIFYLFVLFSPIIYIYKLHNYIFYYWDYSLTIFLGMCLSDLNHLALDYIMPLRRLAERFLG